MKTIMFFKKLLLLIVSLTLTFTTVIAPTYAEEMDKTDGLARVVLITAKDGQNKALEDAIAKYHHYMGNKKGAWHYQWYSIETGPNTGKYIARSGNHNWADFDAKHDWDEAAGKKFVELVQPHIENAQISITRSNQDLGIWPDSMDDYQYFLLSRWHIKPGKNDEFVEGLKKIDGILKKGGWPNYYAFVKTVSGGYGNTQLLVSPRKNFADMAPKEPKFKDVLQKSMGEKEADEFLDKWGMTYKTGNYWMLKYLPKQSDYGASK